MEAKAKVTGVRITPRKVRLVIDTVRGKNVSVALGILANMNRSSVTEVTKLIKSAAANAVNNNKMDESKLYIAESMHVMDQDSKDSFQELKVQHHQF